MTYFNTIIKLTLSGSKISSLRRPPSLLAHFGRGRHGLWGMGSSGVGVGEGSDVLARGGVPVLVLLMGVRFPGLGMGFFSCWRAWAGDNVGFRA